MPPDRSPPFLTPTGAEVRQQQVSRRMMERNCRQARLKALKENENSLNRLAHAEELRRKLESEIKSLQQGIEGQAPAPGSSKGSRGQTLP